MKSKNEGTITIPAWTARVGVICLAGLFLVAVVYTLRTSGVRELHWPLFFGAMPVALFLAPVRAIRNKNEGTITIHVWTVRLGAMCLVAGLLGAGLNTYLRTPSVPSAVYWSVYVAMVVAAGFAAIVGLRKQKQERVGAGQQP